MCCLLGTRIDTRSGGVGYRSLHRESTYGSAFWSVVIAGYDEGHTFGIISMWWISSTSRLPARYSLNNLDIYQ